MHHKVSKSLISELDFYYSFDSIMLSSSSCDRTEFFNVCGKQHYRLLSYLSTMVDNSVIIDIGTHRGQSALALSYNPSNEIYTFDIEDKVTNNSIKNVKNINFQRDNLFENDGREKWYEMIMKSSFIFLDVDPHNGTMEIDLYNYLKTIGYKGFVVCDDIWHFKDMRDKFWYKVPNLNKFDLTEFGHDSGTGIFTFNSDITFDTSVCEGGSRNYNDNWTLVTAYFNLTNCADASYEINQRDSNYYMSHSMSTLHLPYNLVIYCDADSHGIIREHRPDFLSDKTHYVICNFEEMKIKGKTVSELREEIIENRVNKPYNFDNRNTASYYLFCMLRYVMLNEVISKNVFGSTHFCWVNFCIERMGISNVYRLDEALAVYRNKFSTCYIDYVPYDLIQNTHEYFRYGRCGMCSGFFTGNAKYMFKVCDLIQEKFMQYVELGYGHADEQLYSPVYFENPELFEHYYGDYNQMITNYKHINEGINAPVNNFIKNSYESGNYGICADGCKFLLISHEIKSCQYDDTVLKEIKRIYLECIERTVMCI